MNFMITGGAGFIGSAVCRLLCADQTNRVVNVDKLTYAGNLASLDTVRDNANYHFIQADITDERTMLAIMRQHEIDIVMHLAAESHVDRSIGSPAAFVETNVVGTFQLLSAALRYFRALSCRRQDRFRFHHVSTDEVFGDLPFDGGVFTEESAYAPSSPYSASKAAADHFVRAWHKTYGLPVVVSNCSNNYGPFHYPEKLIPLAILDAMEGRPVKIYGTGANVRDWLFVEDHARALQTVATRGRIGQSYAIGGRAERRNIDVVHTICDLLDTRRPRRSGASHRELVTFGPDRPGHDRRYAIDPSKIEAELGWRAAESFESGVARTVDWYLANEHWWRPIRSRVHAGGQPSTQEAAAA